MGPREDDIDPFRKRDPFSDDPEAALETHEPHEEETGGLAEGGASRDGAPANGSAPSAPPSDRDQGPPPVEPPPAPTSPEPSEALPEAPEPEPDPAEVRAAFGEPDANGGRRGAPRRPVGPERIERTPPQDLEAEVCVLGSLLLDRDLFGPVSELLEEQDFYRESHKVIYRFLLSVFDETGGVDIVLLREALQGAGELEKAGGPEALVNILDRVPTAAHGVHYAKIVRAHSLRRKSIVLADRLIRAAYEGDADADPLEVLEHASREMLEVAHGATDQKVECVGGGDLIHMDIPRPKLLIGEDAQDKSRLLAEGQLMLFSGPPKVGKSLLVAEAMVALATGDLTWLNFLCHGPIRVGVVEAEGGLDLVQDWLRAMAADLPREAINRIRVPKSLPKIDLTKPKSLMLLRRYIEAEELNLLALDPFFRLHRAEENDNREMSDVLAALEELRIQTKVAMMLVHHTAWATQENTKGRSSVRSRGASVIAADADTLATCDFPEENDEESAFYLYWDIRRGPKPPNLIVLRDAHLRHHPTAMGQKKADEKAVTAARRDKGGALAMNQVKALLAKGPKTLNDISRELDRNAGFLEILLDQHGAVLSKTTGEDGEKWYGLVGDSSRPARGRGPELPFDPKAGGGR